MGQAPVALRLRNGLTRPGCKKRRAHPRAGPFQKPELKKHYFGDLLEISLGEKPSIQTAGQGLPGVGLGAITPSLGALAPRAAGGC